MSGSVDAHSHILFGVDDGASHREDALAMLEYEETLGVREVWCTPHIMEDVPNTTEELQKRFELIPSQRIDGKVVERPCYYVCDFAYCEGGKQVIEDAKGMKTEVYKIKKKLMLYKYGIAIKEV